MHVPNLIQAWEIERSRFFPSIYIYIYSLLTSIGNFDFIYKTKFSSLPNFATYHLLNKCHVSNMCMTHHLSN